MENNNKSLLVLSTFILEIIAILCLILEHFSWMLSDSLGYNYWLVILFEILGAVALPLLLFIIAEKLNNGEKAGFIFLFLGIAATGIAITSILIQYVPIFNGFSIRAKGNIFIDVLLASLAFYLLSRDKWYFKILSVIPLSVGIVTFFVVSLEYQNVSLTHWFPYFIRPHYHFYGVLMGILIYVAHIFKDIFLKQYSNNSGIPVESLKGTSTERIALNISCAGMIMLETLLLMVFALSIPNEWVYWDIYIQNAAIISGAFILLYNGRVGYNAKWLRYSKLGFYSLHLLIIYLIGLIIINV